MSGNGRGPGALTAEGKGQVRERVEQPVRDRIKVLMAAAHHDRHDPSVPFSNRSAACSVVELVTLMRAGETEPTDIFEIRPMGRSHSRARRPEPSFPIGPACMQISASGAIAHSDMSMATDNKPSASTA